MKLKIDHLRGLKTWFGWRFRVSAIVVHEVWDNQYAWIENHLFDRHTHDSWRHICHLKPEIREWLETTIPYADWSADHPKYLGDNDLGIRFRHMKHVLMFKLAWSGL